MTIGDLNFYEIFDGLLTVALATPSVHTRYQSAPSMAGALVVGVSQSGRSPDLITVVEDGRAQGALTLAVTNETIT